MNELTVFILKKILENVIYNRVNYENVTQLSDRVYGNF